MDLYRAPAAAHVLHDEGNLYRQRAQPGLLVQRAVRHRDDGVSRQPGGPAHRILGDRRCRCARRAGADRSAPLHDAGQQGRAPRWPISGSLQPSRAGSCGRAARIAARGDRAGSGRGSARSTSSGRVSRCLPGPAAAERVRRNRVHVFAGDAQPARDRELPRWCAALRGVCVQQDLRGRNVGAVEAGDVAGSPRPHRVERALDDLDASGEEHAPRLACKVLSSGTASCGSELPWRCSR